MLQYLIKKKGLQLDIGILKGMERRSHIMCQVQNIRLNQFQLSKQFLSFILLHLKMFQKELNHHLHTIVLISNQNGNRQIKIQEFKTRHLYQIK